MKKPQHCSFEHNRHAKTGLIFHSGYAAAVVIVVCVCVAQPYLLIIRILVLSYHPIPATGDNVNMVSVYIHCHFIQNVKIPSRTEPM